MYTFDRLSQHLTTKFWRCDKRHTYKCKARLHTRADTGEVIRLVNEHNHDSDPAYVGVMAARNAALQRAEATLDTPAAIISEVVDSVPVAVRAQMPSNYALRQAIRRRRRAVEAAPPPPISVASTVIPEAYQTYGDQERFLLYDSGLGDEERILVFGRQSAGDWSSRMKNILTDGTFRIAPPRFAQAYVIMAERGGFVLPVLYALLPNKQELTYRRMFEGIKATWPQFDPETITLDFEEAAMNAVRATFPAVQVYGCFFHFVRSVKRQIAQQGLLSTYNANADFSVAARMIASLAFVPTEHLEEGVKELSRVLPRELIPVLAWAAGRGCIVLSIHSSCSVASIIIRVTGQSVGSCTRRQSKQTMVARKDAQRTGSPSSIHFCSCNEYIFCQGSRPADGQSVQFPVTIERIHLAA
ncbi:hypothetical protein D918_06767 [Trichuris suis]|nr:hypothetical protein D918_06767 [Trichuris suis]